MGVLGGVVVCLVGTYPLKNIHIRLRQVLGGDGPHNPR